MALLNKIDYWGLSASGFEVESTSENKAVGFTAEARGENGFLVALEVGGERIAPTVNYIATNDVDIASVKLGEVKTIGGKQLALGSLTITTGAGEPVRATATGSQIEDGGEEHCTATLSGIALSPLFHAQTFGLFSYTNGQLTNSTLNVEGTVATAEKDGVIVASDLVGASIRVSGTLIGVTDAGAIATPTLSVGTPSGNVLSGVITQPLTLDNPNGDYPSYNFEITFGLKADDED